MKTGLKIYLLNLKVDFFTTELVRNRRIVIPPVPAGTTHLNNTASGLSLLSFFCFFLVVQNCAYGQTTQLEHTSTSYVGTLPSGPITSYQKARFVNNSSEQTFTSFDPDITVTAWFSDQQYNNVAGVTNLKGVFFGGASNDNAKAVAAQTTWKAFNSFSNPTDNQFTSNPIGIAGQGIAVDVNYGFNIFTTVEPLYTADRNKGDRYYYGKLTLKFTRAVANPVLHIVGLGGSTAINTDVLGYSTELELDSPTGVKLQKLSGNDALKVESNKILNGKSVINDQSSDGAATGSVAVQGSNITTIVFKIYLRGDGKGTSWSGQNIFRGDQWLMGFSMNAPNISGNVFDDGNALKDSKVNPVPVRDGKGTNIENKLRINLLNGSTLVSSADVGEDGGFVLQDFSAESYPTNYKLVMTSGDNAGISKLPNGWTSTGENLGTSTVDGNDGLVDGKLAVTMLSAAASIQNANFGINKQPISEIINAVERSNPGGSNRVSVPALTGTDLEDGDYGNSDNAYTVKINTIPDPKQGVLYYENLPVTQGQVIVNYVSEKLTVDPADGAVTMIFTYSHKDAADKYSDPAEVSIPFRMAYQIGGNVFNDGNGMHGVAPNINKVDGPGVKRTDLIPTASQNPVLFVSAIFGKAVVATTAVKESGDFQFAKTFEPETYDLVLHTTETGSATPSLPEHWINTGENSSVSAGCDGSANGILKCSVITSDASNYNFGINKAPEAFGKNRIIDKPGTDVYLLLDGSGTAPAISGYDLEDKTLGGAGSKVVVTKLPLKGKLYYGDQEINTVNTIISESFSPSLFKVRLSGASYSSAEFSYAFVDQAGIQGTEALYQLTWNSSLPVNLGALNAKQSELAVLVTWNTVSESSSERFDIEHSINGKQWDAIGMVLAEGESTTVKNYSFTHSAPAIGQNLYRLKMIDNDQSYSVSRMVNVDFKGQAYVTLYPNPASEYFKISSGDDNRTSSVITTQIFDLNGRIVLNDKSGSDRVGLKGVVPGMYVVRIQQTNGNISTHRISIKN